MTTADMRTMLSRLAGILENASQFWAFDVRRAADGSDEALEQYLVSNDLWGGSGSIADSAFTSGEPGRREFCEVMIELGRLQMAAGKTNVRTDMWVTAFELWLRKGLV